MATLPIYRLRQRPVDEQAVIELAKRLFAVEEFQLAKRESTIALRSGSHLVEADARGFGCFAADESLLWNPQVRPSLPNDEEAIERAVRIAREHRLLPEFGQDEPFRVGKPTVGGTRLALQTADRRADHALDVQVNFPIEVGTYPVVGGGGSFHLTFGDGGRLIGFRGVWRPVDKQVAESEVIPREKADAVFREQTQGLRVVEADATLAYTCAPAFTDQEFLYPVYVYRATAEFGDRRVPLRQIAIPATEFGPALPKFEPQPPRAVRRMTRAYDQVTKRRGYATMAVNPFECGTSWIGGSLAQQDAQGFVDGLAADGWLVNFNWGEANAWESDWRRNDDIWVDAADFVFYTGHANQDGWVLSKPDDTFLSFSEVGGAADLWGQQDLEWAVIAACGPLQDDLLSAGGGNVLTRWQGAFDGLHMLLGYGAITFFTADEGTKLTKYAKQGTSLLSAWLRTGQETQPSTNGAGAPDGPTVWVGAMWVARNGADPSGDHLWGHGSVSADPTSPTTLAAMWTTC